jgi:predicted 2-oxoglutarate/Fe(II)-dependent dioxygenase YbiX
MNARVGDYIRVYDDILTKEECEHILSEYKNSEEWHEGTIGENNQNDKSVRNCDNIGISVKEIIGANYETRKKIDDLVCKSAGRSLHKYIKDFPDNNFLQYINSDSGYEILRYNEGGLYKQHTDAGKKARTLSLSFSLNDDYTGGEFAFFDREIKIKTKPGSVILFPSNFMYPHEIMPVTKGTRYSIITWFN